MSKIAISGNGVVVKRTAFTARPAVRIVALRDGNHVISPLLLVEIPVVRVRVTSILTEITFSVCLRASTVTSILRHAAVGSARRDYA